MLPSSEPVSTHAPADRPPLRARKRARTREEIIAAAYRLFESEGYGAVTVEDIVDAAEVSRSTFFRYFGDKQEVVFAREVEVRREAAERAEHRELPAPDTLDEALEQLRIIAVEAYRMVAKRSAEHKVHERLIDENAELFDRHVRKLLGFADDMAGLLERRGASRDLAVLASRTAVACCLAARERPEPNLASAVDRCFAQLVNR